MKKLLIVGGAVTAAAFLAKRTGAVDFIKGQLGPPPEIVEEKPPPPPPQKAAPKKPPSKKPPSS